MSAIPIRQEAAQRPTHTILKLYNSPYTLDPYHDRLVSQGYQVMEGANYVEAIDQAHRQRPDLFLVYDDPEAGVDALRWIEMQHNDRFGWMATTPLIVLCDSSRLSALKPEELPDRIMLLPRRSDTLNQLARMVKQVFHLWGGQE